MTDAEKIADLEARLKRFEDFFTFGVSDDGLVPYVKTSGRVGIMTEFWQKKPVGQGATFAVGTAIDRYAGYFEIDGSSCPDHPSVAVFASVVAPNGQPNHAFEGTAANGSENRGLVLSWGDLVLVFRREGMELLNNWTSFMLGKISGPIRQLWP